MAEAGARVLGEVRRAREAFPGGAVVMVSHCDAIRAALCAALRLPLDEYHRFEVAPASLSVLSVRDGGGAVVAGINEAVPEREWRAATEAEAA